MKALQFFGFTFLVFLCVLSLSNVDVELGNSPNANKVFVQFPRYAPLVTIEYESNRDS